MDAPTRRRPFIVTLVTAALAALAAPSLQGQQPEVTPVNQDRMTAYVRAYIAVAAVRDAVQAELAQLSNKTPERQVELREKMRVETAKAIQDNGLTEEEYHRITYVVSVDNDQRAAFEETLAELSAGGPS